MADEIIEPGDDGRICLIALIGASDPLSQDRLENADEEERSEDVTVVEMGEQIGVMVAVGEQHAVGRLQHVFGLRHVAESGAVALV